MSQPSGFTHWWWIGLALIGGTLVSWGLIRCLDLQPSGKLVLQPSSKLDLQPSGKLDLQPSGKLDLQPGSKLDLQPSGKLDLQPSGKLDLQPSGKLDLQPSSKLGCMVSWTCNCSASWTCNQAESWTCNWVASWTGNPVATGTCNPAAAQWLLGLATWQQCKKHDGGKGRREGKGRGPGSVFYLDGLITWLCSSSVKTLFLFLLHAVLHCKILHSNQTVRKQLFICLFHLSIHAWRVESELERFI